MSRSFLAVLSLALRAAPGDGLRGLMWTLRGKRQRGWNGLSGAAADHPAYYRVWMRVAEPRLIDAWVGGDACRDLRILPLIVGGAADAARATRDSVRATLGRDQRIWTTLPAIADGGTELVRTIASLPREGWDWLLPLRAGDAISPDLARILRTLPEIDAMQAPVYWDEDLLDHGQRCDPWIKPDWDPILFAARDYLTGAVLLPRAAVIEEAGRLGETSLDESVLSALVAAIAGRTDIGEPRHVPLILSHRVRRNTPRVAASDPPRAWPKVSIIVPTRDRPELLDACVAGLRRLAYPGESEWIIVDNGSMDPQALALLDALAADPRIRVLRAPGPFNFSALNNRAVDVARGDYVCLLNNDVVPCDGEWLTHMVRHAVLPDAGAIGALLFYPDMTVQHAGVAIGIGGAAGHVQRGVAPSAVGEDCWSGVTRTVSAVSAACLVVRRDAYLAVGGLDEEAFGVAFNDVDFCLKLGAAGWRNIQVAEARLIHHESKSRGQDSAPENAERFAGELSRLRARWHTADARDPWFSPLFSPSSERCLLRF